MSIIKSSFQGLLALCMIALFSQCKKEKELPQLSKATLKAAGPTFADVQGRIYVEGSSAITQRGICWEMKTSPGNSTQVQFPTIAGDTMQVSGSTGFIALRITGLQPDTAYYARFFAVNEQGVQYGYPVLIRTSFMPDGSVFVEGHGAGMSFAMGSLAGAANEQPLHDVVLANYFLSQHEVTNAEYCIFLNELSEAGKISPQGIVNNLLYIDMEDSDVLIVHNGTQFTPKAGFENHPVVEVSWYGAKAYCIANDGTLPSEAAWEFAARGGLSGKGNKYAGSNDPNNVAWFGANAGNQLHAVGGKQPNELAIRDMTGNVWEWCEDWYGDSYYAGSAKENPTGPSSGTRKVLRGGSYSQDAVTNTSRHSMAPDATEANIGFRVRY